MSEGQRWNLAKQNIAWIMLKKQTIVPLWIIRVQLRVCCMHMHGRFSFAPSTMDVLVCMCRDPTSVQVSSAQLYVLDALQQLWDLCH